MLRLIFIVLSFFFVSHNSYGATATVINCPPCNQANNCNPATHYMKPITAGDSFACSQEPRTEVAQSRKDCTEAVKKYKEHQAKDSPYLKACQTVKAGTDAKTCLDAANKCENCIGSSEDEPDETYCQTGDSDENSDDDDEGVNGLSEILAAARGKQAAAAGTYIDEGKVRRMQKRFNNCPLFSKDELDDIIDLKEKHEEAKKEGQALLDEKEAELKKAQGELLDLQEEQAKIVPDYTERFNEIVGERSAELQAQLQKNGEQLVDMILNLQTAEMQFVDAKNAIYKVCFDLAQQALDKLKNERNAKISAGQLRSKGGFAGLTKQTSTARRLERFANSIMRNCKKKNTQVKQQIRSAEKVYEQTIKRLNLQVDRLQKEQRDIANKLMKSAEDPVEKKLLKALKKEYEKKAKDIDKQIKARLQSVENLSIAIKRIRDELNKDEVKYAHYLEQEKIVSKTSARDDKSPSSDDFLTAASAYEEDLNTAYNSCLCDRVNLIDSPDPAECPSIRNALEENFGDVRSTPSSGGGTGVNVDSGG